MQTECYELEQTSETVQPGNASRYQSGRIRQMGTDEGESNIYCKYSVVDEQIGDESLFFLPT